MGTTVHPVDWGVPTMIKDGDPNHEPPPSQQNLPRIEVYLSRAEFRPGTAVVGTVRLLPHSNQRPRTCFTSANIQIIGKCRIDPRWHNAASYCKRNSIVQLDEEEDCTVWATNVVDLLQLPERKVGMWRRVGPRPLLVPPDNPEHYFTEDSLSSAGGANERNDDDNNGDTMQMLENLQLTFTFRTNLSEDLAPTVSLTCCRYYYHVRLHVTTYDGSTIVKLVPFTVLSTLHEVVPDALPENGSTRIGSCIVMAHSSGLPCHVSADEIYAPQGHTTVIDRKSKWDTKTMRVSDPSGNPCCILTVFGSSVMSPGVGQLLLQFDFEQLSNCHLVSACLEGYETAKRSYDGRGDHRTRTLLLDANHDIVEPGYTERVPLQLHLPPDCPVTLETDIVRVQICCRVDITISNKSGKFTNLRLTLPVRVVHPAKAEELEDPQEEDNSDDMRDLLLKDSRHDGLLAESPTTLFETKDILQELKILSLLLVEKCNLLREDSLYEI